MLVIQNLHAGYGQGSVLHGVNLEVRSGSIMALLGRNGMGKTTLMRAIMGLLRPLQGTVRFGNCELSGRPPHEIARIGLSLVSQGRDIFPDFTVSENLRLGVLGLRGRNIVPEEIYEQLPSLNKLRAQKAGSLSVGQQQLLAIGRALAAKPSMLLLDEPTEGLQPSVVNEIATLLTKIAAKNNVTVLIAEQNIDVAMMLSSSMAFMENGIITEVATTGSSEVNASVFAKYFRL